MHEGIRKAKAEVWTKWVEDGKWVWDIARVARNPFNLSQRCGELTDNDGGVCNTKEKKCKAFVNHNIVTTQREQEAPEEDAQRFRRASQRPRKSSKGFDANQEQVGRTELADAYRK